MCGIIGISIANKTAITKATSCLKHRGPDAQQVCTFTKPALSLGHARLSILDLSNAANQPFTHGDLTIVFNGEIYNFNKIKQQIVQENPQAKFKTTSDTEVILHAYQLWGEQALENFNGMFAFAIFNKKTNELFLARDRFGIKPLYFTKPNNETKMPFAFSSEINALTKLLEDTTTFIKQINKTALTEFFNYRYTVGENTMLENIHKFLPGHYMKVALPTAKTKRPQIIEYKAWYSLEKQLKKQTPVKLTYKQAQIKLKEKIKNAVKLRMVSDVPVATFLSGGLDSSVISTLAKKHNPKLNTFSIGFETTNELEFAKLLAKHIKSKHHILKTNQQTLKTYIPKMITHMDEPIGDPGFLPILYLSEQVAKKNKVILSGDGADEILCGYERYKLLKYGKFLAPIAEFLPSTNNIIARLKNMHQKDDANAFFEIIRAFEETELKKLNIPSLKIKFADLPNHSTINKAMVFDIHTLMPNDFFMKSDKMSSAFGLEQRVPFMDHNVVEFAFSLPDTYKLKLLREKAILKDAFKHKIPPQITKRQKHGFNVPIDHWFANELGEELRTMLNKSTHKLYNTEYVLELLHDIKQEDVTDKKSHSIANRFIIAQKLWTIYVFEIWYTQIFE